MGWRKSLYYCMMICLFFVSGCDSQQFPLPDTTPHPTLKLPTHTAQVRTRQPAAAALPSSTPEASNGFIIKIDPTQTRQTLRDVGGGNYVHRFGATRTSLEPVSLMNLEMLQPDVIRTRIDLDLWEPLPNIQGSQRFHNEKYVKTTFEFIKEIKTRNPDTILIASIWTVPDWMVVNPAEERKRVLNPNRYPDVVESIAQWLLRARSDYGAKIDYVSFNEANIGINVLLTSEEQIQLIRLAGKRFEELGLSTRWLLGDTSGASHSLSYSMPIYADEKIRPYLGPLSFHSWDVIARGSQMLKEIGRYADQHHLEVWCTEGGWNALDYNRPEDFQTWNHAVKIAEVYTLVLRDSRATSLLYWQMMGDDYIVNDGKTPFPALIYMGELKNTFPAGSQIVKTPDDENQTMTILSLAARTPGGGFSVELVNQVKESQTVTLAGLPDGTYSRVRMADSNPLKTELDPVVVKNGTANLELDGLSMTFLKRKP